MLRTLPGTGYRLVMPVGLQQLPVGVHELTLSGLRKMIGNLLCNACQHTERGQILVQLVAGWLVIEDTGVGIPQKVRARLFERFVHDDDRPAHEGAGLGLSIVKRVVDHSGWDLRLEIPAAGGTRFILCFPIVPNT